MLVTNILATDMTKHGRMVQKLTRRIKATFEYEGKIEAGMEIGGPLRDNAFLSERYEDRRVKIENYYEFYNILTQVYNKYSHSCLRYRKSLSPLRYISSLGSLDYPGIRFSGISSCGD